jgi:nucleotide-binding universal stress UspA family protein
MFEKILVCLDGSKLAEQVLPYAAEEAIRFDGRLILFRVVAPITATSAAAGIAAEAIVESQAQAQKEATSYLESVAQNLLDERGLKVDYLVMEGLAAETIVDFADNNQIGLIAIATHGEGGLKRLVFGSVADYVLRNSNLPMLVVKPVERED